MTAVHSYCALCGRKTSVQWVTVPWENSTKGKGRNRLVCAGCLDKIPTVKPKGTVEK